MCATYGLENPSGETTALTIERSKCRTAAKAAGRRLKAVRRDSTIVGKRDWVGLLKLSLIFCLLNDTALEPKCLVAKLIHQ